MTAKVFHSVSEELIGKEVTLCGIAAEAKAGEVIVVSGVPVYLPELDYWREDLLGKKVYATGTLFQKKLIPDVYITEDGGISQGASGEQYVLESIKEIREVE